jgi:hypothetical protein
MRRMITVFALRLHLVVLNLCRRSEFLSDVGAAYGRPKPISWQLTDERRAASVLRRP